VMRKENPLASISAGKIKKIRPLGRGIYPKK
jgi:hypothetical protein